MDNKLNEGELLVNRVKLLMGYDMSKTLNENTQYIFEQPDSRFENPQTKEILARGEQQILQRSAEEKSKKYPNWCKYPDKALGIPKNPEGVEGEDAILVDKETGKRFCYYPSPSNQKMGDINSVPIPEDSKIYFWDIEGISDTVNKFVKKHPKEDKKLLISNLSKVFPIGSVRQFSIGDEVYIGYVIKTEGTNLWRFGYYRNLKTKEPYTPPEWVDKRSDYQRFVDDYGFAIQIAAALGTAIAGMLTGGAAWVLYAEIALEAGLGAAVGFRELEKGENVSAALSFITGALPMLKLSKMFRGIPEGVFTELSEKLSKAGLTKSSNVEDYVKFYNGLSESEQLVMSKLLTQDEVTKNLLLKELKTAVSDDLPKIIIKELKNMVKSKPELLKSISFFNKLWARELSTNAFFILLGILVNAAWGDVLNSEDLEKLKGVYINIPEELQKEMAFNLLSNDAEVLKKLPQTESVKKIETFTKLNKKGKSWGKYYNTVMKDSIQEAGGVYTELPEDENKAVDNKKGSLEDEKKLRKEGFIPESELKNENTVYDYTQVNGVNWFKIKR
jgi:hypothetical protein